MFRKVFSNFWEDTFVELLTPQEKYFFLFILTNPRSSECGIYELSKKKMMELTGYGIKTIEKLIKKFIDNGKIKFNEQTNEIAILNRAKYITNRGKPVIDCIIAELIRVKDKSLISSVSSNCPNNSIKTVYDSYDLTPTYRRQEEEEKEEKEEGEGEGVTSSNCEKKFEEFRKIYPGRKRGLRTEYNNFRGKYPKDYQNIVQLLLPAIHLQIECKTQLETAKKFIPEWKHLKTWIDQRCWEEEIPSPSDVSNDLKNNIANIPVRYMNEQ